MFSAACLFAVIYGVIRTTFVLVALALMFNLDPNQAGLLPSLLIVTVGSLTLLESASWPHLCLCCSREKGAQMTYVIEAGLLLVSGVYYPVTVLPGWLEALFNISPATYILSGVRTMLIDNPSGSALRHCLIPLIIIGIVTIPLGVWIFGRAEHFAEELALAEANGVGSVMHTADCLPNTNRG